MQNVLQTSSSTHHPHCSTIPGGSPAPVEERHAAQKKLTDLNLVKLYGKTKPNQDHFDHKISLKMYILDAVSEKSPPLQPALIEGNYETLNAKWPFKHKQCHQKSHLHLQSDTKQWWICMYLSAYRPVLPGLRTRGFLPGQKDVTYSEVMGFFLYFFSYFHKTKHSSTSRHLN